MLKTSIPISAMNRTARFTLAAAALLGGLPALAAPAVFTGAGANAAAIQAAVDNFRNAVGSPNNGANNPLGVIHAGGRREINWDAPILPGNPMPPDFFNRSLDFNGQVGSRRGAEFTTPGSGFLVSQNTSPGDPNRKFGDIDVSYESEFQLFSNNRLFGINSSTLMDTYFYLPNVPSQVAAVNAFGVVFTDVDLSNSAGIWLYDESNVLLASAFAPVADKGLSFVGIQLDPGLWATRVRIQSGTLKLGPGNVDDMNMMWDVVAMDDFIYSEPMLVPEPATAGALAAAVLAGLGAWTVRRRRRA